MLSFFFLKMDFSLRYKKMIKLKAIIFVTGASGKIGQKLVVQLLNKGFGVMALVRNRSKLQLKDPHLKIIEADLLDSEKFARYFKKCDYVYHLAAYQNISDLKIDEFIRVNVEGTKKLLRLANKSKVKKFIYVSTAMVFSFEENKTISERSTLKKFSGKNYYVETKLLALKTIRQYKNKVPVVVLYPSVVIDQQEIVDGNSQKITGWRKLLWEKIGGGIPGGLMNLIGKKDRVLNYIFIDNLLTAMINVMKKGQIGDSYILGGENITAENYLKETARIKKRVCLPLRIPVILLKLISLIKIPQLKLIEFIAQNPPENMKLNPQKAIKELSLTITYLKNYR